MGRVADNMPELSSVAHDGCYSFVETPLKAAGCL